MRKPPSAKIPPALKMCAGFVKLFRTAAAMNGIAIITAIMAMMISQIIATTKILRPSMNMSVYLSSLGALLEEGASRTMRA
jgi:hypothetical protein